MKKHSLILTALLLTLAVDQAFAQPDTIIVYNINTVTIDTVLPVWVNPTLTFNKTESAIGSLGNQVSLDLSPPTTNLFSNSSFSDLARAELFFNVTDYPIRTATRLFYYKNGVLSGCCSGMMVGENFVLTAGHCAYNYTDQIFGYDSILIAPAYDNASIQPSLPTSVVEKVYLFKTFYDKKFFDDIALLQLRQPIGQQIGWIGMAFNSDTSFINGKVFHKLSYPGVTSPFDTSKHYNGDTLYYNYGYINNLNTQLGINSPQARGIPGQSGSSLFYTDNSEYFSMGVASFSSNYCHYKITKDVFYQLKSIMENNAASTQDDLTVGNGMLIYPNPFSTFTTIQLNSADANSDLIIYNLYGQQVKQMKNISAQKITLHRDNIPCGMYFIRLTQDDKVIATERLVITN
ncbi:MAG: T9SS type A sorting domain-containing protein [Bacteroidota bacterium]